MTSWSRDSIATNRKGFRPFKILQAMQNKNPLRKQALGKSLDGQIIHPVYTGSTVNKHT